MPPQKRAKYDALSGCPSGDPRAPFGKTPDGAYTNQGRVLDETKRRWSRPALPTMNPQADEVVFMQVDTDQYYAPPDMRFWPAGTPQGGERPVIRMFGVTGDGNSVTCHVHGFQPYFFVKAVNCNEADVRDGKFKSELNKAVAGKSKGMGTQSGDVVEKVEWMMKQTLMNYQSEKAVPFIKVTVAAPHLVTAARGVFEGCGQMTYESNVVFPLRFMIDHDLAGGQWAVVPAGGYVVRTERMKTTHCQLEIDIHHDRIEARDPMEGDWGRLAPLRILSYDIECYAKKGFPEASKDPVCQIASLLTVQGQDYPTVKNVLTLGTCDPIAETEVIQFEREEDLLRAWSDLVVATDPDIITGYNINNFDFPYLLDRAAALRVDGFARFSRVINSNVKAKATTFSSKAQGTRESKEITVEGRVPFDLLQVIQRDYKLSSYSLNSVASEFLADQKEDVHYSMISVLQEGNEDSRRRLAVYCVKDAWLPQQLLDKLMFMYNYIEMARVTGVPISFLLGRGQMIKVQSQLLRKAGPAGLVMPTRQRQQGGGQLGGNEYEGATVLDAISGYYDVPIATLDFASLYPSIMQVLPACPPL